MRKLAIFNVVTPQEEALLSDDPLKKIRPIYDIIKAKCLGLYPQEHYSRAQRSGILGDKVLEFKECITIRHDARIS